MTDKAEIRALVEQHIAGTDQFLVDVKLSPNRLAIFIDKPDGVKLEECSSLGRFITESLEISGFLESHEIEVSSPGMDTPLLVPQQYLRRIGRELKVINTEGREMTGILLMADNSGIELKETVIEKVNKKKISSEVIHTIKYVEIREAKIVINFKFNK